MTAQSIHGYRFTCDVCGRVHVDVMETWETTAMACLPALGWGVQETVHKVARNDSISVYRYTCPACKAPPRTPVCSCQDPDCELRHMRGPCACPDGGGQPHTHTADNPAGP